MAAADLTVRNGVGVDAEAVLRPLDWRSSLRTRAATRRPLAGVASLTESLVVRCGDDAGLLLRIIQLLCGNKPAACTAKAQPSWSWLEYKGHVGPAQWKGGDWAGSKKRK